MNFSISKKHFVEALSIASRAISPSSPLASLHSIKLEVMEDMLKITASDSNISILININKSEENKLTIEETGEILFDSKYIVDMIRKIDSETVEVETVDGYLTRISGGSVNFEINGFNTHDYPVINFDYDQPSFTINSDELKLLISQTCFATSDKETKPVLTGLNMRCVGNEMTCVATDSYRMAQKKITIDNNSDFNITVPAKALNEVAKILPSDKDIDVFIFNMKIMFKIEDIFIQALLIEGSYPETTRLIPNNFNYELVVDARDILGSIDRASLIKNDGVSIIKMSLSQDEIIVSSKSNEIGLTENITPVSYEGNDLRVSFKVPYVYDAVRALNAFQIKFQFVGEMKPFIIKSVDDDSVLQLVLPIRTYN